MDPNFPQPDASHPEETARTAMIRALAQQGITAHPDDYSMIGGEWNTWLVVSQDRNSANFPAMDAEPHVLLYLYNEEDDEITVDRAPRPGDDWHMVACDGAGKERTVYTVDGNEARCCAAYVAEWVSSPQSPLESVEALGDLRGSMQDGGTPENARKVFQRIHEAGGPYLVCVWEYVDKDGFGGQSHYFVKGEDGALYDIQNGVYQWLDGERAMPVPMDRWADELPAEPFEIVASDNLHNCARTVRTG
ncbi:hypothetical protein ABZ747_29365 [Kitasatospora cineracea]|uniref:hypothetical protein n=1 Tax=Kitasatospora cineracea TaxID=88074 RepID=UPI0033E767E7